MFERGKEIDEENVEVNVYGRWFWHYSEMLGQNMTKKKNPLNYESFCPNIWISTDRYEWLTNDDHNLGRESSSGIGDSLNNFIQFQSKLCDRGGEEVNI